MVPAIIAEIAPARERLQGKIATVGEVVVRGRSSLAASRLIRRPFADSPPSP
jgi:hypothetical protein